MNLGGWSVLIAIGAVGIALAACGPTSVPGAGVTIAEDGFGRSVSVGLGRADVGGPWLQDALKNATASVNGSAAILTMTAPAPVAYYKLPEVNSVDQNAEFTFQVDQFVVGATMFLEIDGRRVGSDNTYYLLLRLRQDFSMTIELSRQIGGVNAVLAPELSSAVEHVDYSQYRLRYQIMGQNPTTVRAKIWIDGQPEPEAWLVTATDNSPVLQAPGAWEFGIYSSDALTKVPVNWAFDNFRITAPR
jgi:hypothetical protein